MADEKDPYEGTDMEGKSADEIFVRRLFQIAHGGMSMKKAMFLLAAAQKEREINRAKEGQTNE